MSPDAAPSDQGKNSFRRASWLATLALLAVALLPRLWGLGAFVTWDEPLWAFRSVHFLQALLEGQPAQTFQIGAPGVITMWSGAAGIAFDRFALHRHGEAWEQVVAQPSLDLEDEATLAALGEFLPATRVGLALLGGLAVPLACLLLRGQGVGGRVAFLAGLLMALDPFLLGHARVLHTDGPEAIFTILSVLALLAALHQEGKGQAVGLAASGGLAGLAVLAKAPAGILAPLAVAIIAWQSLREEGLSWPGLRRAVGGMVIWGVAAAAAFALFWPAMWSDPLGTLGRMFGLAGRFARTPHVDNFFLGQHVQDPGPLFYPLSLAVRTTPVVWLGVLGAVPLLLRPQRGYPRVGVLWLCILVYGAALTLGAKKFERYLLPAYPLLDLIAASGWAWLAGQLGAWVRARRARPTQWLMTQVMAAAVGLAALVQGLSSLPCHPHYLLYANPLLGGTRQAVRWLPAGWGEGLEKAAAFLKEQPDAQAVALWPVPAFVPLFPGRTLRLTEANLALADYVIIYIGDVQFGSPLTGEFYGAKEPLHTVILHGAAYAWVYRNEPPDTHVRFLSQSVAAGDLVVADAPLLAARTYRGPARVLTLEAPTGEADLAQALNGAIPGGGTLWYLSLETAPASLRQAVQRQLDTHALATGSPQPLPPGVTARRYVVPEGTVFGMTEADRPADLRFGESLALRAFGLSAAWVEYPQVLEVLLRWEATAWPGEDYTAFVHLLDGEGHRWAQSDVPLAGPDGAPTSRWRPGTAAQTRHRLALPPGIPPGTYHLMVGLYDPDGERLAVGGDTWWSLASAEVAPPRFPPSPDALSPAVPLKATLWRGLTLWGASLPTGLLRPGDTLTLALDWWAQEKPGLALEAVFELATDGDQPLEEWVQPLAAYSTGQWRAGEAIHALYDLRLPADLPAGEHLLTLRLRARGEEPPLAGPQPLGKLTIQARPHRFSPPPEMEPLDEAVFGDDIHLLGYRLAQALVAPGGVLPLTLFWQAEETPDQAYKVFVHLTDETGKVWAQQDREPQEGQAPTTGWLPGEVIFDEISLGTQPEMPPGQYNLWVGLYDGSGQRLPLPDGGTAYRLATVAVR